MLDYDWKSCKVKAKDRHASCMISPEGDWYNIETGDHAIFAYHYLLDQGMKVTGEGTFIKDKPDPAKALDYLIGILGWIYVEDDWGNGTVIQGRMKERQYTVLKAYFKDNLLFRGWTVEGLYQEQRSV